MNAETQEALASVSEMAAAFLARMPFVAVGLAAFAVFFFGGKWLRYGIRRLTESRKRHGNLGLVLGRLVQGVLLLLGALVALVIILPGFKPVQLIEFLGIGTIAIGFAFRDILQNFLAGILILLTEPFRIGDQIVWGELEGQVEEIETRATSIRTYDGRRIVIPNTNLFTNAVTVNTAYEIRRLEYDLGIGVGDDIDRAKSLILESIKTVPDVLETPAPDVLVVDLGSDVTKIRARWWIKPPRQWEFVESRDLVLTAVKKSLTSHGIDLPFPTRTVLFHDQTDETDGDRARQREGWPTGPGKPPPPRSIAGGLLQVARALSKAQPPGKAADPPKNAACHS